MFDKSGVETWSSGYVCNFRRRVVRIWAQRPEALIPKVANIIPGSWIALEGTPPTEGPLAGTGSLSPTLLGSLRGAASNMLWETWKMKARNRRGGGMAQHFKECIVQGHNSQFPFQSQRKAMSKNAQTTAQLHSSHTLAKQCLKFSKPGFNSTWTMDFQMFKLDLTKAEEPEIKLPWFDDVWSLKRAREFQKNIYSCFIDYTKGFDCVDHNKLWKILKDVGIRGHLTCLLRNLYAGHEATVRTGHGKQTGSKLGKEYVKAVYCHPDYLTYMQCTSWEMLEWMKHKLESRFPG